jgi:hypothetical protein
MGGGVKRPSGADPVAGPPPESDLKPPRAGRGSCGRSRTIAT